MKTAIYAGRVVTPHEFQRLAGSDWREKNRWATCKICETKVHPNFMHSIKAQARFDHLDNAPECPLSSKADPRYAALRPSEVDMGAVERVRTVFLYSAFYLQAMRFCEFHIGRNGFNEDVFKSMVERGDQMRIWGYRNIAAWTLPYVLLSLCDFQIPSAKGTFEIQFHLLKPVGLIDDLWLKPGDCKLAKIFRDSGKQVNLPEGNPYPVSEGYFWATGESHLRHFFLPTES